jgi:putative transcriptional regulator
VRRTTGRLLVAEPQLGDPNFDRTVVLVLAHDHDGAHGLVLNRPTDVPVVQALPSWAGAVTPPGVVHIGGPVEEQTAWCLALVPDAEPADGFEPIIGDLVQVEVDADPALLAARANAVRLYAGYSGWGPSQLEWELQQHAWIVVDAEPDDPFLPDGHALWKRILTRQGGSLARLANFPHDPSLN